MHLIAIFATWIAFVAAAPHEQLSEPPAPLALADYRLPNTIKPVNYKITLRPYLLETDAQNKRFTFEGETFIEIMPNEDTNFIHLHSKKLTYSLSEYWEVTPTPSKQLFKSNVADSETDIWKLETQSKLIKGKTYILHFVYVGSMDDDMHGFYRSSYVNDRNETKWLGSTQFQTHHARRAFPSFDEPKFKATFDVTLIRHKSYKTVSNTRTINSTLKDDYFTDVYATTPIMSTYLLAFIVSEFNERTNGDFSILARPEYYAQTEYSFDVGQSLLAALGNYFALPYYKLGNDKMHMAAIPDFSAGAMENWGLLTYRERALLYEDSATTLQSQQSIAAVVAHEQTHQWFGDLVTCDWWSYAWLNEGFARYFQYFSTDMVVPEWEMEKQFIVDQIHSVMILDSTNKTNPMSDENTFTPTDLGRMFNTITYNKGASVIRMLAHTIGEANFKKSLQEYLKKNQYTSAIPQQLLDALKANWPETTKAHADAIFKSFTTQVGYPLITANLATDGKSVEFSQKRFLLKSNDGSNATLTYTIPITYTTSEEKNFNNTATKFVLNNVGTHKVELGAKAVDWFIANVQEVGYYRVTYTEKNWHGLHHALTTANWGGIPEQNRAQIVDDLLNLARASVLTYDLALNVLEYLSTEVNYVPWSAAFNGFNFLTIRLGKDVDMFNKYILQLTSKSYGALGFNERPEDRPLDILLRAKILAWNCKFGNGACINRADVFLSELHQSREVSKNIRSVVYCSSLRHGSSNNFELLYQKFKTETVATEQTLLQNSFGCVKDQKLIERVFDLVLSDEIRKQDKVSVLTALFSENNSNVSPVFELITKKFEQLAQALGGYAAVADIISSIAGRFTEEKQKNDLIDFNKKNGDKFGSSLATLTAAVNTVTENLEWDAEKLGVLKTYLAKINGSASLNAFTMLTLILIAIFSLLLR